MLKSRYLLAFLDENQENNWHVINRQFILEKNDDIVRGVFLQDLWFNYKLKNIYSDNDKSIKFMIIKSRHNVKKINELLTNEFGHIRDLHEEYYVFTLTYEKLINIYKEMSDSKNTRYNCKLLCENVNISLTLEILEFENDHYITLPKFQLSVF